MLCVAQFSELTKAIPSSTTIDFSCVRLNSGFPLVTSTPARMSLSRVASFSTSPLRRAGFSITNTLTPRRRAPTTAWSNTGSEKTNIFTRSDFEAPAMASRKGLAESSGRTTSDRDDTSSSYSALERVSVRDSAHPGLDAVQVGIDAAGGQQFVVGALLRDTAILQDDDLVGIADGAQAVSNGDHGAPLHEAFECLHQQPLRLGIERRSGLVEDEDGRVADDRARDADALPLAAGERLASFAQQSVVTLGHPDDEPVRIRELRGLDNLFLAAVGPPVSDVLPHRGAKQDRVLQHESDLRAQALELVVANVYSVDEDPPRGRIVESRHQTDDRGFSCSRGARNPDELAGRDREAQVPQHRDRGIVAERHAIEADRPAEPSRVARVRTLGDAHVDIEDCADALHPDRCLGNGAAHLRDVLHGFEELAEIRKKDRERSDRHCGGRHERGAPPEDEAGAEGHDHGHDRRQERFDPPRLQRGLDGLLARVRQVLLLELLPAE